MANLDRSGMLALLERLGAADDAAVLEAARTLDRTVRESGMTWDELLRPDGDPDVEQDLAEEQGGPPVESRLSEADTAEATRLIERLLARGSLSDTLREDLGDLKGGLADGSFEATDLRYLRALAKRLGA
jgi:hypothetical protein